MKKYLSILAVTLVAASAFAQGTVSFVNTASQLILIDGTAVAAAQNGRVHLLWAPESQVITPWSASVPLDVYMTANSLRYVSGAAANVGVPLGGRFSGGTRTAQELTPSGAVAQFVVIGWAGGTTAFADYAAAFNGGGFVGVSAPFLVDTGDPTTVPAGTAGAMTAFTGLTLVPVPEPTSFALAGLAGAALLIFRRRN